METKEERVTRQEGLLHNHKQEIPVETSCHRTFGDRLSQSRSLGLSFRSLALRARSLALRARTIALRAQKLDL